MSFKKRITNWFGMVKGASRSCTEQQKMFEQYIHTKYDIIALESLDERPNANLEQRLGSEYCEIKYCPEDVLWGSLYEDDIRTIHMRCPYFSGNRCTNIACPLMAANHKYFDAKKEFENKVQEYKNNVRLVFGIKTK